MQKQSEEEYYEQLKKDLEESNMHSRNVLDLRTEEEKEMEIKEYERKYKLLKQKEERDKIELYTKLKEIDIRKDKENIFTLMVDGSEHSKAAFELIQADFLKDNVLHCIHIFNTVHDEKYNWRYQKAFVVDHFNTKLQKFKPNKGFFTIQEGSGSYQHHADQVTRIAAKNQAAFIFFGFYGLKTQTLLDKNLSKGLDFILKEPRVPIIVIKDGSLRETKPNGFKWLLLMDRASSLCLRALDPFLPLIDLQKDFIYGLTLLPGSGIDDLKKPFEDKMAQLKVSPEKYAYQVESYERNAQEFVIDFVNHNHDHSFDFVVFYNNPDKFKVEKDKSDCKVFLTKLATNLCFVNTVYIEAGIKNTD